MVTSKIKVASDFEARSLALFVQKACKFSSQIKVSIGDKTVNAKSIMGVISLGISDGEELTVAADGVDEKEALKELTEFISLNK